MALGQAHNARFEIIAIVGLLRPGLPVQRGAFRPVGLGAISPSLDHNAPLLRHLAGALTTTSQCLLLSLNVSKCTERGEGRVMIRCKSQAFHSSYVPYWRLIPVSFETETA